MGKNNGAEEREYDIKEEHIANLSYLLDTTEKDIMALKNQVNDLQNKGIGDFGVWQKMKNILRRLEVNSGLNWAKLLVWIGMADAIIFLSSDINTKIISAITYFMGIIFDMLLLRKQQPENGAVIIRFVEGFLILAFLGNSIVLGIGLAACSLGQMLPAGYELWIDWSMPVCGILSTSMELINSIIEND